MPSLLYVKPTVRNFSPCDYGLNRLADSMKKGQRAMQLFSYFTHPVDLLIQAAILPPLLLANPFVTVGINLAKKQWTRAVSNAFFIPLKLALSIPSIGFYEAKMAIKFIWSISGANTCVNVFKGEKQKNAFFLKQAYEDQFNELVNTTFRGALGLNHKKIIHITKVHIPKNYQKKEKNLSAQTPEIQLTGKISWIKENDKTYFLSRIPLERKINSLYLAGIGGANNFKKQMALA